LLFAQGELCFFCNKKLPAIEASVEHLVPRSKNGSDSDENCVACCKSLNQLLGSKSLKEKIQIVLNQKGQFACPNGTLKKVTKTAPPGPPKAKKLLADCYQKVVTYLKRPGTHKPRTVTKLKNTVAALSQNKLSQNELDTLIQQLQNRQEIFITGSKVTYADATIP